MNRDLDYSHEDLRLFSGEAGPFSAAKRTLSVDKLKKRENKRSSSSGRSQKKRGAKGKSGRRLERGGWEGRGESGLGGVWVKVGCRRREVVHPREGSSIAERPRCSGIGRVRLCSAAVGWCPGLSLSPGRPIRGLLFPPAATASPVLLAALETEPRRRDYALLIRMGTKEGAAEGGGARSEEKHESLGWPRDGAPCPDHLGSAHRATRPCPTFPFLPTRFWPGRGAKKRADLNSAPESRPSAAV
ncbi:hypothetical protein KM043_004203 [Ampulex compressa]|nr:hypothetical protein KM043_004203 [Ampulex compressa]